MTTIALFDFDIITFHASAAVEKRTVEVSDLKTGRTKIFKTRTAFKDLLKEKDIEFNPERWFFQDIQVAEPEAHAFQIVKSMVKKHKNSVGATDMEGYVGDGPSNFRLLLDLPEKYKGNRDDLMRPLLLKDTKKYALENYPGGLVKNYEVDDHLVVRYHQLVEAGHDPVIISLDKDSKGCVGTKFYDWTQPFPEIVSIEPWGFLNHIKEKNKVDGLGLNFYCYQLLAGDTADGYTVKNLHGKRFGDTSIVEYLNQAKSVDELFKLTEAKYKEWFPEPIEYKTWDGRTVEKNYAEVLQLYHECVYMKRMVNDQTNFWDLWREFK